MSGTGIVDTAETYGWDTVFGIHIADANQAIIARGTSPKTFSQTNATDGVSASGAFGPWQITTGGDGDIVRLSIPITSANVTVFGKTEAATGSARVDVRLDFLEQAEQKYHLKVSGKSFSGGTDIVSIDGIDYTGTPPSFLAQAALRELLTTWMNDNLTDFDHVFATVDLSGEAAKGAFAWMSPTDKAYAYSDIGPPGQAKDGVLGVLCMVGGAPSTALIQQISPVIIPTGQRAGFLISKQRLLSKLLLPNIHNSFPGSAATDFKMSDTGDSIINATGNIGFTVTHDGKTYTADVDSLTIIISAEEMQMDVLTTTEISPGIKAKCHTQNFLGITLINKPDGTQTLGYKETRTAIVNHWQEVDPAIQITEEILGIIAIIVGLIAIAVSGGAAIGIVVMIIGLVVGVMMLTTAIIEKVKGGDAPSIDMLVLNSTAAITWADSADFKLGIANLNDSLVMGGTFEAAGG